MIVYLDSSSLAKLYIGEAGAEEIRHLVSSADAVTTSALAYPEIRAALARRRRERTLTPSQVNIAKQEFESDWATMAIVRIDGDLVRRAGDLAEKHALRGADAVHLAAFERLLSASEDDDVEFSCADERLTQAARKLG